MDKKWHVMLDLETLSTEPNAVILSIGAARFDPNEWTVAETFEAHVDLESTNLKVFDISPNTVNWWMSDDRQEARAYYRRGDKTDLVTALWGFRQWLKDQPLEGLWGNGAAFDNVILRKAYELCGEQAPWAFRQDRCFRTLKNLPIIVPEPERIEPAHSALGDAIWQALYAQRVMDRITSAIY
jgi:hypothetical protein